MILSTMLTRNTIKLRKRRHSRIGALTLVLIFWTAMSSGALASGSASFENKPMIPLTANDGQRQIYPLDNGFVLVSRLQEAQAQEGDLLLEKLTAVGKQEWSLALPQAGEEELKSIQKMGPDLGVVLSTPGAKGNSIRMLCLDSKGKTKWEKALPLKQFSAIAQTNDNGAIIVGVRSTGIAKDNLVALKMDASGSWSGSARDASRWEVTLGNSSHSRLNDVVQVLDKDGYNDGYILAGSKQMGSGQQKDILAIRLDAYGALNWQQLHGCSGNDEAFSVTPLRDGNKVVDGFAVAGYTERGNGQEMYLLHLGISGALNRWPGTDRAIDGEAEKFYGGSYDTVGVGVYPVPSAFDDSRTIAQKSYAGDTGIILLGIQNQGDKKTLMLVRVTEKGRDKWQSIQYISGTSLMPGEANQSSSDRLNVAYSSTVPADLEQAITVNTLKLYLDKISDDDKTLPQYEKNEQNTEDLKWETQTFSYEIPAQMKDRSKDIKKLLAQQNKPSLISPRSGWGDIDWPDTSYYLGNLVIGKADGEGTLLFPNGVWYKGAWKNNMFNGNGYLRYPTGEYYQGEFKDHMTHGKGIIVWPTGEKYEGDFFNDRLHGQGKFSWPGGVFYEGGFSLGLAEGMGIISWPNGERYEGQMQKGKPSGQGSYYFPNGEWYKGELKDMIFEGVGVYHWSDGAYYVGEFKQDRLNGEGYYVWPNGVQQWGYWKDDHYMGINKEVFMTLNKK